MLHTIQLVLLHLLTNLEKCLKQSVSSTITASSQRLIVVYNTEGHVIASDQDKADAIKTWFETQFTDSQEPLATSARLSPPNRCLNGVRKVSNIALYQIQDIVNHYTGPWQCGYNNGCCCVYIVWYQGTLISVVLDEDDVFSDLPPPPTITRREFSRWLKKLNRCGADRSTRLGVL